MTKVRLAFGAAAIGALCTISAIAAQPTTQSHDTQPFTHFAYIPASAELSSIRFEGLKMVRVSGQSAYQVTYSYRGQPLASDEHGGSYFTFSVYLRLDEVSPELARRLAEHKIGRAEVASFFELTTSVAGAGSKDNATDTAPPEYVAVKVAPASAGSRAKSAEATR